MPSPLTSCLSLHASERNQSQLSSFCLIAKRLHLIMHPLYTRGLSPDDFADGRWQISAESFVVSILGNVLAVFQPIENGVIIAAQCNLGVDPGTMQRALSRSGDLFLRFAQPGKFRLQFLSEFPALRADLDKKRFQICPLYLLRGFLKTVLPVAAPFNQMFHYIDDIVLVHLNLPRFDAGAPFEVWHNSDVRTDVGTRRQGKSCTRIVQDIYDEAQIQRCLHDLGSR